MSNLKLPEMTYKSLRKLTPDNGKNHAIAYATTVSFFGEDSDSGSYVLVAHHGHPIGMLYTDGTIWVHNAGYSSSTTASRIHKILSDNDLPFAYAIRERTGVLFPRGLDKKAERRPLMWPGAIFTPKSYTARVGNGTAYADF